MLNTILLFLFQATPRVSGTPYPDTVTPEWSWFTIIGATVIALLIGAAFFWSIRRSRSKTIKID